MIVTSRRSLILGATSLVAAPSLVRAASMMGLGGEIMDPRVVVFYGFGIWHPSMVNDVLNVPRNPFRALRVIREIFVGTTYELRRMSELGVDVIDRTVPFGINVQIYEHKIRYLDRQLNGGN